MNIKTKLKLIGLLPMLMAGVFALTAYDGQRHLSRLNELTALLDRMQDRVEQIESAVQRFVATRADTRRQEAYVLSDVLESQLLIAGRQFERDLPQVLLNTARQRLAQARWHFMELDALYRPAITVTEIARAQQILQAFQNDVSYLKPLLHRLRYENHLITATYSNTLWKTQFTLIAAIALLILILVYPVLYRIGNALHVLSQGTRKLGKEGIPPPLRLPGQDEFSQLADDFNRMAQRLAAAESAREQHTRELENAVKDLENFSYSVSHDLRSPLRAIDGFTAILLDEYAPQLDAEGLRLFGVVQDNAKKMEQLIDDILALSRAGRLELQATQVDMNQLVDAVWAGISDANPERVVDFRRAELPPIACDVRAMRQVWQNLLDNALKFTKGRQPALIEVSAEPLAGMIRYSVRDNGAGFDADYANKLFGLFLRLHGADEFPGTGVGLAIVKRFIQKHHGEIEGCGVVDGGATFSFTLPIYHPPQEPAA